MQLSQKTQLVTVDSIVTREYQTLFWGSCRIVPYWNQRTISSRE